MIPIVSEAIDAYAAEHSSPEPALLAELAEETRASMDSPQMMVGHSEGLFLRLLARLMGARRVLEIGTFTGYSSLCLAEGLPADGRVITCDVDPRATAIARRYWARSAHGAKITLELRPALETLAGLRGPFDMVFIDADKQNYIRYWEACVPHVRAGGALLADNVLWSGKVLDPREKDDHAIVAFNQHVARDLRVERVVLPLRDGLTLAVKR
ncbi:MAG: class I SAM-dependent methyltransferase [Candidatus Krumholzibacteria bacterium]|nr:class I SAM-dependent methyltransferase [Candidatus Krumholzibacteria bacterium]MDH4337904.1 class I SAM-dependent methyltransferase [Candidatus Krumholzibacteria bacterium]MDH5270211.1 class I SAM-dependent methyltransferase [Candidatus Krumholzibacteria bacterium]